ncbi:hypothetical protein [Roseovarius nubinhibens]|uniref:Oligosaccharide repeat unit polymerase n=1 Tax=Roseovarius nubinhibens TaxID=314263 RepID=A0A348WA11_9RHOB|nr:hypothetical protein [Roseovarius nubinhibens]|tara:strand:- start:7697 stop:8980 length:1284 start_codon:yes stop_codon:yes gene_type:complete
MISFSQVAKAFLFLIVYFSALLFVYVQEVVVHYQYMGFPSDFGAVQLVVSVFTLFSAAILLSFRVSVQNFLFYFAVYLHFVPFLVLFTMGSLGGWTHYIVIVAGYFILWVTMRMEVPRIVLGPLAAKSILQICLGLVIFAILSIVAFGGWRLFNLNLFDVYEFRREASAQLPSVFGYIISPVAKIVIPLGLVLGSYFQSKPAIVIFVVLTVFYFGLTHHKSVLFAPIAVWLIYSMLKRSKDLRFVPYLFFSIIALSVIEIFLGWIMHGGTEAGLFTSVVVRRVILIPSLLDGLYVDFFSGNELIYWAQSKISFGLVESGYDLNAPFLIGDLFFNNSEMSANTGVVGSGFANAGVIGTLLYFGFLGVIIAILASHGRALGEALVAAAALNSFVAAITSTDIITLMLTHGLLFLIFLLALMPNSAKNSG